MYEVKNVPAYALRGDRPHWVARMVDGELWFWGAYWDKGDAVEAALNIIDSVVLAAEECVCV